MIIQFICEQAARRGLSITWTEASNIMRALEQAYPWLLSLHGDEMVWSYQTMIIAAMDEQTVVA